jgi:hypothetical protein
MRSINRFMGRAARAFVRAAILIFVTMLLAPNSLAATPSQAGVSWDYKLLGPLNSAQDPETELTILITGSGSFDLSQQSIDGGGSYAILDTQGSVVGSGTWTAMTFDSFTPAAPGGSPGEGGHLELEALFVNETGTGALDGSQHVVIQCSMWGPTVGPPGYPWPPDFVEVGPYTVHQTGAVMFNLNQ